MQKLTRTRLRKFFERHKTDLPILDIGAGSTDYKDIFPNRTTLDIDPARKPDIVGDAEKLPFKDASWDAIICSEVFEHLPHPEKVVSELWRVLTPGGTLIMTTDFIFPVHAPPGDYWRYTPYTVKMLFKEWEIVELSAETDVFSTIAVLLQRIMFQTKLRGGKFTKGILSLFVRLFAVMDPLVLLRYGDIERKSTVDILLTSGVYLVARKPKSV